jgi:pentatricopeptide repeat protein
MITAFGAEKDAEGMMRFFSSIRTRHDLDEVVFRTVVEWLCRLERPTEGMEVFQDMPVQMQGRSLLLLLEAFETAQDTDGATELARWVLARRGVIHRESWLVLNRFLGDQTCAGLSHEFGLNHHQAPRLPVSFAGRSMLTEARRHAHSPKGSPTGSPKPGRKAGAAPPSGGKGRGKTSSPAPGSNGHYRKGHRDFANMGMGGYAPYMNMGGHHHPHHHGAMPSPYLPEMYAPEMGWMPMNPYLAQGGHLPPGMMGMMGGHPHAFPNDAHPPQG